MAVTFAEIRKPWAVLLAYSVLAFLVGVYPYLTVAGPFQPIQLAQVGIDALAIYGLFGFVVRRPLRHLAARLLFRVVACVVCARALAVVYLVAPNLRPWAGTSEQKVSLLLLLGVPLGLLVAAALWLHTSDPRRGSRAEGGL